MPVSIGRKRLLRVFKVANSGTFAQHPHQADEHGVDRLRAGRHPLCARDPVLAGTEVIYAIIHAE